MFSAYGKKIKRQNKWYNVFNQSGLPVYFVLNRMIDYCGINPLWNSRKYIGFLANSTYEIALLTDNLYILAVVMHHASFCLKKHLEQVHLIDHHYPQRCLYRHLFCVRQFFRIL